TVQSGQTVPTLVDESHTALLMVLGSRGLGGFTGALAGSTAVGLVSRGHCPVAVIRDPRPAGPVVVGVDGSPASEAAVAWAFEEASMRGTELVAVHTWSDLGLEVYAPGAAVLLDWEAVETGERELLARQLAGWKEKYPDVAVRREVIRDRPVRGLLAQA